MVRLGSGAPVFDVSKASTFDCLSRRPDIIGEEYSDFGGVRRSASGLQPSERFDRAPFDELRVRQGE